MNFKSVYSINTRRKRDCEILSTDLTSRQKGISANCLYAFTTFVVADLPGNIRRGGKERQDWTASPDAVLPAKCGIKQTVSNFLPGDVCTFFRTELWAKVNLGLRSSAKMCKKWENNIYVKFVITFPRNERLQDYLVIRIETYRWLQLLHFIIIINNKILFTHNLIRETKVFAFIQTLYKY